MPFERYREVLPRIILYYNYRNNSFNRNYINFYLQYLIVIVFDTINGFISRKRN